MRAASIAAAILSLPLTASAGPFHDVIKFGPRQHVPRHDSGVKAGFTQVSHVIYLNPCLPNGCTVLPGFDDSRTNHSSIASQSTVLTPYPNGAEQWSDLVQCVRDLYAPFNITVTDVDPGTAPHFEVMIAGHASDLDMQGAGGVAPFIPCDGQLEDNVLSFVFAGDIGDLNFQCWAAAQESSHTFGLDHELEAKDPMTYLTPPLKKPGFQNVDAECGEELGQPRECWCGGTRQNSYQYLMDTFGPASLEPPTMAITSPADGQWVKPGFSVKATSTSQLSLMTATFAIDGTTADTLGQGDPLVFSTPSKLAGGDHTLKITATDSANRTFDTQITVHVTAVCDGESSCADGFGCLGGFCLPGPSIAGGLGAPCSGNEDCITGLCGTDGENMLCTGACDHSTGGLVEGLVCPDGYACLETAPGAGVCWPGGGEGGGCSTSDDRSPLFGFFALGLLVLLVRRR